MKPTFYPKVRMMDPAELVPAGFNPSDRVTAKNLATLMKGITALGGVVQPVIVSSDKRIGDGHRRVAAAIALGLSEIPVIVLPLGLQETWAWLNDSQKPIMGRDWVQVHYMGFSLENIPKRIQSQILRIKALIGDDGFAVLAEKNMTTAVLREATQTARYIDDVERKRPPDSLIAQCLMWLIVHNQQYAARRAREDEMSPAVLRYAIVNNQPVGKAK